MILCLSCLALLFLGGGLGLGRNWVGVGSVWARMSSASHEPSTHIDTTHHIHQLSLIGELAAAANSQKAVGPFSFGGEEKFLLLVRRQGGAISALDANCGAFALKSRGLMG